MSGERMDDEYNQGKSESGGESEFSPDDEWRELCAGIQNAIDNRFVRPHQDFEL